MTILAHWAYTPETKYNGFKQRHTRKLSALEKPINLQGAWYAVSNGSSKCGEAKNVGAQRPCYGIRVTYVLHHNLEVTGLIAAGKDNYGHTEFKGNRTSDKFLKCQLFYSTQNQSKWIGPQKPEHLNFRNKTR